MPYRCNSSKLVERNIASMPFTPRNYQKMNNATLNSSCDSVGISDEYTGSANIVPSTFYSDRTSGYLSPLQRKQLKRNVPSLDENINPTLNSRLNEPKQAKPAKRGKKSLKSPEVKKRAAKPRSSNSNGAKKRKSSKGLEITTSKRESPKEVEQEDGGEKYKNNKFFKHGPMGYLRGPISWKIFASGGLKPFSTDRKKQSKAIGDSDKMLVPIENKTMSSSDIYDSLPDDNVENSIVATQSDPKSCGTLNGPKKWIANSFIDTSLPNVSVAGSPILVDQSKDGQIPRSKSLPMQSFPNSDYKVHDGGVKQQLVCGKVSVDHRSQNSKTATRGTKRKQSQLKQPLTDAAKKLETKVPTNQQNLKSAQQESSVLCGSKNLDTNVSVYSIENQPSYDESIVNDSPTSTTDVHRSEKKQKPASDKTFVIPGTPSLKTEIRGAKRKQSLYELSLNDGSKILEIKATKNQRRPKSTRNKSLVISGSDSLNIDISTSIVGATLCHESELYHSHISETELQRDKKRQKLSCTKSPIIHSIQTSKTKIIRKRTQSSLCDSSITSDLKNLQSTNQTPQKSELIQDIFKDLEDTFNEIEPSVSEVQSSGIADSVSNVSLFGEDRFLDSTMGTEKFLEDTNERVDFLEGTLGGDDFLENTNEKEGSSGEKTFYPIFCAQKKTENSFTTTSKHKNKSNISTSSKNAVPEENTALMIDAGQKVIGAVECPTCGMVLHVGSEQDEKLHAKNHEMFILYLKFPGWKREHVVGEYYDGRIVMIKKEDQNFMLKKVEDVLKIVDRDLGFPNLGFPKRPNATFLLFVFDKTVVGCLVAESITSARRVELDPSTSVSSCFPQDNKEKSERWCSSTKIVKAICGINRIWVSREYRRKKIATRLLNCLGHNFLYGYTMSKKEMAFSDPSVNGRDFATVYMGTSNFLVYK